MAPTEACYQYWVKLNDLDAAKIEDDRFVWIISPVEVEHLEPVAAFRSFDIAAKLAQHFNQFVEDGVNLRPIPASDCHLEVDRFASLIKAKLTPYFVSLDNKGELLEFDMFPDSMEEVSIPEKLEFVLKTLKKESVGRNTSFGLSGTFWANTLRFAVKKAKLYRKMLLSMADNVIDEQKELEAFKDKTQLRTSQLSLQL